MPTDIEWTRNADGSKGETWNPTLGCSVASPGCDNCYAARLVMRNMTPAHAGLAERVDGVPRFNGTVRAMRDRLDVPLRWRKPRTVFVDSMSDLFHPGVEDSYIAEVFARMAIGAQHTFQVLTKRPQRMAALVGSPIFAEKVHERACDWYTFENVRDWEYEPRWPLPNVWLGTSIENDAYSFRARHLREAPAAVRFVSAEPLLGPLPHLDLTRIDWLIVGGESGPKARPMHLDWVRELRDRCADAETAFFFKQHGEFAPWVADDYSEDAGGTDCVKLDGSTSWMAGSADSDYLTNWSRNYEQTDQAILRVGKKVAGRELDGRTYDAMPERAA